MAIGFNNKANRRMPEEDNVCMLYERVSKNGRIYYKGRMRIGGKYVVVTSDLSTADSRYKEGKCAILNVKVYGSTGASYGRNYR